MTPRCLNFIPISAMGPRNLPEDTHLIFQPALVHWSMCLYLKFELCTQRWHIPSQNHEPSWEELRFARNLYQNLFLFCNFFYHSMLVPCHDTKPSFMIFMRVFDLQELKNQVSQSFQPSHDGQMFEFQSHFLHGTYKFTQRHTCDFSVNFGAWEHVLVVQIWIMHIKWPETRLMYKKGQTNPE